MNPICCRKAISTGPQEAGSPPGLPTNIGKGRFRPGISKSYFSPRLLKKSICFVVFVAAEAAYGKEYASFLAPRFNRGLAYGAFWEARIKNWVFQRALEYLST